MEEVKDHEDASEREDGREEVVNKVDEEEEHEEQRINLEKKIIDDEQEVKKNDGKSSLHHRKPPIPRNDSPAVFDEKTNEKFKAKYFPLWFLFSILIIIVLVSYTYGKSRAQNEYNHVVGDLDQLIESTFKSIDPIVQKWKDEVFNKTFEPLRRYLEKKVDPIFDQLKFKLNKYKRVISQYINLHEDEATLKFLEELRSLNFTAKHPIVIIPGSITSNLEVWEGKPCMNKFREKVWGGLEMFRTILSDMDCWIEHIMLDEVTGLDPENIRVRPRAEAIEYFVPFFWVWARMIEELSRLGYDRNNLKMMEYDWRLSYDNLQKRDNYFARVKMNIELLTQFTGEKVVILTHSMGGLVANYFLNWVESSKGGNEVNTILGLKKNKWCDKHIESVLNIGSPILGLPKVLSSLLSGEMKDTADLYFADNLLERILSKEKRIKAFRSWGSMLEMIPKGPAGLWGNLFNIPSEEKMNITMDSLIPFLKNNTDVNTANKLEKNHFFGVRKPKSKYENYLDILSALDKPKMKLEIDDPKYWSNPFSFRLPYAPNMKIYCLYGVGVETEIGYKVIKRKKKTEEMIQHNETTTKKTDNDIWSYEFDFSMDEENHHQDVILKDVNGDGTCPRVSMGYACSELWKKDDWFNPGDIKTVTKEYSHKPIENILSKQFDLRGGGFGASHVDILGNLEVLEDVLKIVSGNAENVDSRLLLPDFEKIELE